VFDNTVLRKILWSKTDRFAGDWRRLHSEELHDLYSLPNIIQVIKSKIRKWAGHVARMGERRSAYRVLEGKPEEKSTLKTWCR
jgi:hypothetical protein